MSPLRHRQDATILRITIRTGLIAALVAGAGLGVTGPAAPQAFPGLCSALGLELQRIDAAASATAARQVQVLDFEVQRQEAALYQVIAEARSRGCIEGFGNPAICTGLVATMDMMSVMLTDATAARDAVASGATSSPQRAAVLAQMQAAGCGTGAAAVKPVPTPAPATAPEVIELPAPDDIAPAAPATEPASAPIFIPPPLREEVPAAAEPAPAPMDPAPATAAEPTEAAAAGTAGTPAAASPATPTLPASPPPAAPAPTVTPAPAATPAPAPAAATTATSPAGAPMSVPSATALARLFPADVPYQTMCVRTCDGFSFPISAAATSSHFAADAAACQEMCPAAPTALYVHRAAGETIDDMMSLTGAPYSALPAAYRYREVFDPDCTCAAAATTTAAAPAASTPGAAETPSPADTAEIAGALARREIPQVGPTYLPAERLAGSAAAAPAPQ